MRKIAQGAAPPMDRRKGNPKAVSSTTNWADFIWGLKDCHASACEVQPVREHCLHMAGVTFQLRMAGRALTSVVLPAMAHLPVADPTQDPGMPFVTFDLWDTASTGILPPRPPFSATDYRRYGHRAVVHDGPIAIMHAPTVPILFAYNKELRHGFFWTADAAALSIYERAAPLQTLFHWAMTEFGWQLVHAAAVGSDLGGVLLIGNTGVGKSTTALSCLTSQNGLRLLSDDKCLARLDPEPQAFAAFSSGKIKADMLKRLPQFQNNLRGWGNTDKDRGKGLIYLYPDYADRLITAFDVKALIVPCVTHRKQASVRPVAPRDAFRVFGPSTVIWLPGAEADNYRFTADLVRRLPCFQLNLALGPNRNSEAILQLIEQL